MINDKETNLNIIDNLNLRNIKMGLVEDEITVSTTTLNDLVIKVQDLEAKMPVDKPFTHNDVPLALLASTATLSDVIKAVNELIKRSLIVREVK